MIHTKIARILSDTEVILAAGAEQGVRDAQEFIIYELSEPIQDPETGESLGELELVKGKVKVWHVQDKMSRATTLIRDLPRPFQQLLSLTEKMYDKLRVEGAVALKHDLTVRVGDLARSLD